MYRTFKNDIEKGHNLEAYAQGTQLYYRVEYVEPLVAGSQGVINFGSIAASSLVAKAVQTLLQTDENHLMRFRCVPIDDCEVQFWEPGPNGLKAEKNFQTRATLATPWYDPELIGTEFWVLGMNRDVQIAVYNPRVVTQPSSRVLFFGWHYFLTALDAKPQGHTTWIPAQGLGY